MFKSWKKITFNLNNVIFFKKINMLNGFMKNCVKQKTNITIIFVILFYILNEHYLFLICSILKSKFNEITVILETILGINNLIMLKITNIYILLQILYNNIVFLLFYINFIKNLIIYITYKFIKLKIIDLHYYILILLNSKYLAVIYFKDLIIELIRKYYWCAGLNDFDLNLIKKNSILEYKQNQYLFSIISQPNNVFLNNDVIYSNINNNAYYSYSNHFPVYKSILLISITSWQYWWWMSFIFIITLFNKIFVKLIFSDNTKINPKVQTSMKSNGRWGDLVASVFPIFWCTNILINSNFILKLTENHSESGIFTLRVRGKQWYWVYKTSVHLKSDLTSLPILIGRDNPIKTNSVNIDMKDLNSVFYKKKFLKKIRTYAKPQKWNEKRFSIWFLNTISNSKNKNYNKFNSNLTNLKPLLKVYFNIVKNIPQRNKYLNLFLEKKCNLDSYMYAKKTIECSKNNLNDFSNTYNNLIKFNYTLLNYNKQMDINTVSNNTRFYNNLKILNHQIEHINKYNFKQSNIIYLNKTFNLVSFKKINNYINFINKNKIQTLIKLNIFKNKQKKIILNFYFFLIKNIDAYLTNKNLNKIVFDIVPSNFFNLLNNFNVLSQNNYNVTKKTYLNLNRLDKLLNFSKNNLTDVKLLEYNKYHYEMLLQKFELVKTMTFDNETKIDKLFYLKLLDEDWYKPYYRHFFTIQQQPVFIWNFKNNIKTFLINKENYNIENINQYNNDIYKNQKILKFIKFKVLLITLNRKLNNFKKIIFFEKVPSYIFEKLNKNIIHYYFVKYKKVDQYINPLFFNNNNYRDYKTDIKLHKYNFFNNLSRWANNLKLIDSLTIYSNITIISNIKENIMNVNKKINLQIPGTNIKNVKKYIDKYLKYNFDCKNILFTPRISSGTLKWLYNNENLTYNYNNFSNFNLHFKKGNEQVVNLKNTIYNHTDRFDLFILNSFKLKELKRLKITKTNKKLKILPLNEFFKKKILSKNRLISCHNALLVPIKTNITVVTNSFDVVHSWFIPGLGIKFDCVPGRSTHYTFRVEKPGVYFGHCAEICGRFHHHMPIKIIAVPMNQFFYYFSMYYPDNKTQNK